MTNYLSHARIRAERRGFALIVVLCFVVLLTAVVVSFFSNAAIQRQVANSSSNGTKAGLFARGALDSIMGDLKQEIVDGSQATTITTGSVSSTYYTPTASSTGYYPTMVLYRAGTDPSWTNLIKRSAYGVTFHPTGNGYAQVGSSRAANVSTTQPSTNGRYYSIPRWNQALLLPPTSATDFTPATTVAFTAPSWILVAQDGSDTHALTAPPQPTATNAVVGRYAYCIYDEGGLLDANVAGFTTPANSQVPYKNAQAYADLTQLTDAGGNPCLTQAQINSLVSWRNTATLQQPSVWTQPNGSSQPDGYYANYVAMNPTGFLKTANTTLSGGQSDHMFTNRQQLINFFNYNLGGGFALDKALQYFGTFSRDLNQPSYVPDPSKPLIAAPSAGGNDAGPVAGSPGGDNPSLITTTGDGRINPAFLSVMAATGFPRNDGTTAIVGEPLVMKRFALNRLAWLTYQGPSATRNLTNPSATGPDADIATLENIYGSAWLQQGTAANIKAYFGLTWGTNPAPAATNGATRSASGVQTTDGAANCWTYAHVSANGTINTLNQVAMLTGSNAREPDFIELLKAAVCAGSLAKPATIDKTSGTLAFNHQFPIDDSLDYAVIQLAANIIDQFDVDGYPTTIYFANSGNTQQFVGIENLPYINRIRCMVLKAAEPSATSKGTPPTNRYGGAENSDDCPSPVLNTGNDTLTDTGVGLAMLYPELWNPHDWNPSDVNRTLGNPRPSQFWVTAQSDNSDDGYSFEGSCNTAAILPGQLASGNSHSGVANVGLSNGFTTRGFASFRPPSRYLNESGTKLTFSLPTDATAGPLFREPTLLFKPGVPAGSSLAGPGLASIVPTEHLVPFVASGGGVKSGVVDANGYANGDPELQDPASQGYIGFYLGAFPLRWVADVVDKTVTPNVTYEYNFALRNVVNNIPPTDTPLTSGVNVTYRVRCQDSAGNWVAYDQKYSDMYPYVNDDLMVADYKGFFDPQSKNIQYASTVDPRTSRFGMMWYDNFDDTTSGVDYFPPFLPGTGDSTLFLNRANAIVCTQRMGQSAGATFSYDNLGYLTTPGPSPQQATWYNWWMTSGAGWYPGSGPTSTGPFITQGKSLRPGLLTQNSPEVINDGKAYDGAAAISNPVPQYYVDADGIARRAMGAYVNSASGTSANVITGLPMATANTNGTTRTDQSSSRPVVLNRPFNSVADLGYVFSGTPWRNIDFFTPESGSAALLDVFCVSDTDNSSGLTAGRVDLNTHQVPVLQAILAGAYQDEYNATSTSLSGGTAALAQNIAQGLVNRTTGTDTGQGPLRNPSELVGKWVSSVNASSGGIDGSKSYSGFSGDLTALLNSAPNDTQYVQRFREASIRALANTGQTRVWSLMIDLVAQVGRYPQSASTLANFTVEGEQHCWIHVAIDRYTGRVLDQQTEIVKE